MKTIDSKEEKQTAKSIASSQMVTFIDLTLIFLTFYPKQEHGLLWKDSIYVISFNPPKYIYVLRGPQIPDTNLILCGDSG